MGEPSSPAAVSSKEIIMQIDVKRWRGGKITTLPHPPPLISSDRSFQEQNWVPACTSDIEGCPHFRDTLKFNWVPPCSVVFFCLFDVGTPSEHKYVLQHP